MEAARRLDSPSLGSHRLERELVNLRPFGEAFVMKNFGDRLAYADAEDAVSDVTLRLHRQIAAGNPPENLQAAFLTGCRNAAIDRMRRHSRKPTVGLEVVAESAAETPAPEEEAERREETARVREVLLRTSPRQRQVLILRFGLGLTVPEIAARMNTSLPAAKNLLARGIGSAREQLEAIEGRSICPEIQASLRATVFDHELAGAVDNEEEARQLHAHLDHCGTCKSFLASLHRNLNELGSGALLAATTAHSAPTGHLARWADHAAAGLHAAVAKTRLAAYKLGGVFNGDGAASGALGSTGQKALAVCGAATATTATCLATGLVGPGVGVLAHHHDPVVHHPAPKVRRLSGLPPATTPPPQEAPTEEALTEPTSQGKSEEVAPHQDPQPESEPESAPTPAEQGAEEFGVESTAPTPEPAASPEPAPAPSGSASHSAAAGNGGAGGGESFGFGG